MQLKGIDAKLFTLEPGSPIDAENQSSITKAAINRAEKYRGDLISGVVAFYDEWEYREHRFQTGKISVADFPGALLGKYEDQYCSLFLHLLKCYKKERSLDKLPWSYPAVRDKLRDCVQTVEDNRLGKCLVRLLKNLAWAAVSAGICFLFYQLILGVETGSDLEYLLGFAFVAAGCVCLGYLWSSVVGLLTLGPSKAQRQDLAKAYVDAMRYIRYRNLWFRKRYIKRYIKSIVPPYLEEAEKELRNQVANVKDVLRRELGEEWLAPGETDFEDDGADAIIRFMDLNNNVERMIEFLETYDAALELYNEEIIEKKSARLIKTFDWLI